MKKQRIKSMASAIGGSLFVFGALALAGTIENNGAVLVPGALAIIGALVVFGTMTTEEQEKNAKDNSRNTDSRPYFLP